MQISTYVINNLNLVEISYPHLCLRKNPLVNLFGLSVKDARAVSVTNEVFRLQLSMPDWKSQLNPSFGTQRELSLLYRGEAKWSRVFAMKKAKYGSANVNVELNVESISELAFALRA